ncbi:hypothetical protein OAA38_00850 [bacterium]|nr:hypothetical protein [bacterium]
MSSILLAATNTFDILWDGTANYLILAGGGGGGGVLDGGGGAGGYRTSWGTGTDGTGGNSGGLSSLETALTLTSGTAYSITVGQGGQGGLGYNAAANMVGHPGRTSSISGSDITTVTTTGGGYGARHSNLPGGSGGSAGGSSSLNATRTAGVSGEGSAGGRGGTTNNTSNGSGGGGGGAGAVGADGANTLGGNGGAGLASTITGTSTARAGGGGGGHRNNGNSSTSSQGGDGGGGSGGFLSVASVAWNDTLNTSSATHGRSGYGGGGGGGGYHTSSSTISTGGNGGSGTVILRLPKAANYNATQLANDTFVQNNGTATYSAASDGSGDHVISFNVATETAHPGDASNNDGRMDWRPFWPDYSNVPVTSGLVVHLDAGVEASYSGSGSTWSDMSGNGNNFTLTNSPTFSSDNAGKLQFNGSNQYASGGPNLSTSNCSFVVIQRYASNNNSARGRILNGLNNNTIYGMHSGNTNAYYAEGTIATTPTGGDTDWHIHGFRENYSGDSRVIYDNNVAPSGQTASGGSEGPNGFMIGKFSTGTTEYSDCEVAVVLVYNRIITTTELTTIFDFYKDRFGIS